MFIAWMNIWLGRGQKNPESFMIAKFGLGLKEPAEFLWMTFEDKQIILPEYFYETLKSWENTKCILETQWNPFIDSWKVAWYCNIELI